MLSGLSYGQKLHTLRFIHRGDELRPIGTLMICVEKLVQPSDKVFDDTFGRSAQTDIITFKAIENYIKKEKLPNKFSKLKWKNEYYEIIDSSGKCWFVNEEDIKRFFDKLKLLIKRFEHGSAILKAWE